MVKTGYMSEPWFTLLAEQVQAASANQVAKRLGYSLTTVSLILNGKYLGKTDKFSTRVLEVFSVVNCPYLKKAIPLHQCKETADGRAPTHNPMKMQFWRSCQTCPKRCV